MGRLTPGWTSHLRTSTGSSDNLVDTLAALDVPEPVIWEIGVKLAPLKDEITTGATPATATTSKKPRWRWRGKEKLAS